MSLLLAIALAAASADPRLAVGLDEHLGAKLPLDLAFTDSTGHPVVLRDLFDGRRPVVLVMAYARCEMLCSVVLHGITQAIRTGSAAIGRDYLPVIVSLDPHENANEAARRRDTLLADIGRPAQRAIWPYLVGRDASVAALADALGFRYAWDAKTEQYAHPAVVFVLSPDGRIAEYVRGVQFERLSEAVARAATGAITSSAAADLLSCFHFDPALRRYGRAISLFLKLGSGAVLVSLTGTVLALVYWERRRRRP